MKEYIIKKNYNTKAIQRLIDSIGEDGGIIRFPKGKYELATLFLKNNVQIYLDKGARLSGTKRFEEYAKVEPLGFKAYQDMSHCDFRCAMFVGDCCENISIIFLCSMISAIVIITNPHKPLKVTILGNE